MMDAGRSRLDLKRKDRSKGKMVALIDRPDGSSERLEVDSNEMLGAIALPSYYEAGALTNRPRTDTAPCDYHFIIVAPASQRLLKQSRRVGVSITANSKMFAQMLAKIALGVAVAKFGVTGFEPLVRNFILNNPNEGGHWVGGFAGTQWKEPPSQLLHRIHLQTVNANAGVFIIVEIRLFAEFGGPTNYVVVGRPTPR
jgi:hypothetical protein